MIELFFKHTKKILNKTNKQLSKIGYYVFINNKHVIERLRSRNIDTVDFIKALKSLTENHICELIYFSQLDKPFYRYEVRTDKIILSIGFEEGDEKRFVIRTVLDPKIHNKYKDEAVKSSEAQILIK